MILVLCFGVIEFKNSVNSTFRQLNSSIDLPADCGRSVYVLTHVLLAICELYVLVFFSWKYYFLLILPFLITFINAPIAFRFAIKVYISENLEAGISREDSLKYISSCFRKK